MVELHHPRREGAAAVGAGDSPPITQHRQNCLLSDLDPLEFLFAMCPVVRDVVRPLISRHYDS
jgi:hypothetical protein